MGVALQYGLTPVTGYHQFTVVKHRQRSTVKAEAFFRL